MNQKRIRSVNWEEAEKKLLLKILKDYVYIIENKSVSTDVNKTKIKTWEKIYKSFNLINFRHREIRQLQMQWKTMKVHYRKNCKINENNTEESGNWTGPELIDDTVIGVHKILNKVQSLNSCHPNDSDLLLPISFIKDEVTEDISETSADMLQDNELEQNEEIVNDTQSDDRETSSGQSEDDVIVPTPIKTFRHKITSRKEARRKFISNITPVKKNQHESKRATTNFREEEHKRRLQMAEEEHSIIIAIHNEKLKCAIIEREILELRKIRETKLMFEK